MKIGVVHGLLTGILFAFGSAACLDGAALAPAVYPAVAWETRTPGELGLSLEKLGALSRLVGGRGCVVRHGYLVFAWGDQQKSSDVASAFKPVLTTLLLMAIQEGRLKSVDDKVADFEPRLKTLNGGKDAGITWRHFASQTSGYGLVEAPGAAYSYNDFALTLYYDTLTQKVFGTNGTTVLQTHLAEPLQFQDRYTFNAFGPDNRPGRLALSVRDFARFGLLYLHHGLWKDRQLIQPQFVDLAIHSPLPADTPLTSGREADMLPHQRSMGGTRNITPVGPGFYSFNWWTDGTDQHGHRLFAGVPPDTYVAAGHGGMRMLWIIPSFDLIVVWNDAQVDDQDASPENLNTKCNQAARLIRDAVLDAPTDKPRTELGLRGARFTINRQPAFLYGISYYGALGASDDFVRRDLDDLQRDRFNWIRVWATWRAFGANISAVDADGSAREPFLGKLERLVAECDRRGMIVDITLSRGNDGPGQPKLANQAAHLRAVETLVTALKPWRNWYLDLSNERNIRDPRFTSIADLAALRAAVRRLDPDRLVTASHGGDLTRNELRDYLETVRVDFISPHRPRERGSAGQTEAQTKEYLAWMAEVGRTVPVHYQEPFRHGYDRWQPQVQDFVADARAAKVGGAAGWCFHNGAERSGPDGRPRRSFDLREQRLFDQLDPVEREAIEALRNAMMTQR